MEFPLLAVPSFMFNRVFIFRKRMMFRFGQNINVATIESRSLAAVDFKDRLAGTAAYFLKFGLMNVFLDNVRQAGRCAAAQG